MAVLFPKWPTDRLKKSQPSLDQGGLPLVLYEKAQSALRLHALDAAAEAGGLFPGQALADARAICPHLVAVEARPLEDAAAFQKLCERFMRYSPAVSLQRTGEAFVDVTGCERLFGGEAAILADLARRLEAAGFSAKIAVAQTPGAAFALAAAGVGGVLAASETKAALAPLPVDVLRIDAAVAERLRRMGLKRVGQLYDMPRAPLAARFGKELLTRLDQALARETEALPLLFPAPHYYAEMRFAEPISSLDAAMERVRKLAEDLGEALLKAGKGGRRFELTFFRVDNQTARVSVRTSAATKSPAHIARLFDMRLDGLRSDIDAGFGFELLRLGAFETEKAPVLQHEAFDRAAADAALSELKDRLSNRLGARRVCRLELKDSHLPEEADAMVPATAPPSAASSDADPGLRRPVKILSHPEEIEALAQIPDGPPVRFSWRRVSYRLVRASGPERIADEWRRQDSVKPTRDYYRVEDEEGRRYWIYREGLYERETGTPRWYLHGFFA
jgi:protein ImuB